MTNEKLREALREIECSASHALAHQTDDDATDHQMLVTILVGIENRARSATWGEAVP